MVRICLYFLEGAFLCRLIYDMVVRCGSLISRCRCFDCSNVAQVTLTWLVRGLFVSSVGFFCPAVLVGMKLGQTYSADLYYPVASNPKTS